MAELARAVDEESYDALDLRALGTAALPSEGRMQRVRLFDRRAVTAPPRPVRAELLEHIAESAFLRRALARVHDASEHAVVLDVERVADAPSAERFARAEAGLFEWLAAAYANGRGEPYAFAARMRDGSVRSGEGDDVHRAITDGARRVVIEQVGLSVLDFFELESGCHIRRSTSAPPEIVRVRVWPARSRDVRATLDEDAERLPPAVRTIRYEPRRDALTPIAIEDYAMGMAMEMRVRSLEDALDRIWRIRMSREDAP
jgi:ATP-dependent Clp protease ATP-binding subunit ClpA/ATP-dependent Clp protease ATP-binding subunit ClpC